MVRILTIVGFLIATPALGQEPPSFDCSNAESSAEELICKDPQLAALDRRVAERFAAALQVVQGLDTGAEAAEDTPGVEPVSGVPLDMANALPWFHRGTVYFFAIEASRARFVARTSAPTSSRHREDCP